MAKPLVIVESPAKAKTLGRFLGNKYRVEASYGHIRDLPESAADVPKEIKEKEWGRLGVDVDQDFTPYYVVPGDKRKQVALLKVAVKEASELLLATDPDREGESISWHLAQVLKPKIPVRRIVFHEITEEAVREALDNPGEVNENLVRAQESRRILDRLYGYTLSPVLWKKVQTGLSAGRVQSVAVRLIVEREEERRAFRTAVYWDLEARLKGEGREFVATLAKLNDRRIASGKDFDAQTGELKNQNVRLLDEAAATTLVEALRANVPWTVTSVEQKPGVERPAPPFTTSTLTQEASRKLGFATERTMQIAQRLFQGVDGGDTMGGLITYHRTDSTTLSDKALHESARVIKEMFGAEYYDAPRRYQTRVKNAQEAHEAIRPTDFRLAPSQLERVLDSDELRIYELIWKRTMASQMVDARVLRTSMEISADAPGGETAVLSASGKAIEFAGFRRAYVEGSDDPAAELEEQEAILPQAKVGDRIDRDTTAITLLETEPKRHETTPPARFTEASLIKELERLGIGRPSTFAPTIATIVRRGYVFRQGKALVPSFTAFAVTKLLRDHFGDFVESDFTAEMEEDLDEISRGEREWVEFLRQFYFGTKKHRGLLPAAEHGAENADYPLLDLGTEPETGETVRVRIGRFGPFVQVGEGGPGRTASLPDEIAPADLSVDKALELVRAKAEGPRSLGVDPATGQNVYVMTGRYGAYVQLGETPEAPPKVKGQRKTKGAEPPEKPKRASLQAGTTDATVTLEEALKLLSLPRVVGLHPDDNEPIVTNFGRFGPYVKHGDEFRSLESEDDVFGISFDAALELIRAPKQSRRKGGAQKKTLRELTKDGATPIKLLAGRYGPYVTDGNLNASIPKTVNPDAVTYEQAVELLEARRGMAPAPRRAGFKRRAASAATKRPRARNGGHEATTRARLRPWAWTIMVHIIGGGLAGSEAAWQAASLGVRVVLHEMRPVRPTDVHKTDRLAELVCSNSFRGDKLDNAVGLLKEEMRRLGSLVMRAADEHRVPAGAALAVDRERFSQAITDAIHAHPLITVVREEVPRIPSDASMFPLIVATGPLTSDSLSEDVAALVGAEHLYFYDAVSPIVLAETIDMTKVFRASRWGRSLRPEDRVADVGARRAVPLHDPAAPACGVDDGEGDYLNCPLTEQEYHHFYDALIAAESATVHDFEKEKFFEGCLPIEVMAHRGRDTLRFGPMKPVGLVDPRTGRAPYAVVQLRQDNLAGDHFSLVGFQTQLKWGEQARVLKMIPGLETAEFVRFGIVHRNTYINGPTVLRETWQTKARPDLFFAGQISGVEGYVESAASGLIAGRNAAALARGEEPSTPPRTTAIGALAYYVSHADPRNYQPTNITFGIMPPPDSQPGRRKLGKADRKQATSERALAALDAWMAVTVER